MKPDSPAFDDDDSKRSPLERLQRRYSDQLSQDIERLEADKAELQAKIAALESDYIQLQQFLLAAKRGTAELAKAGGPRLPGEPAAELTPELKLAELLVETSNQTSDQTSDQLSDQLSDQTSDFTEAQAATRASIKLPIPATSEQRRQLVEYQKKIADEGEQLTLRKGLMLSAIATIIMAWHFCVVGALGQGGSWLGVPIGQLGIGFVPAVALLWLRMLVMMPALGILAPQLYRRTWEDLQSWIYTRDQLLMLLVGSGTALFFSQVLIYQCIGIVGPAIGTMLLFLYPLTAVPLGSWVAGDRKMSPLGLLAIVAIAMGGILAIRPVLRLSVENIALEAIGSTSSTATPFIILLGVLASVAFSLYVVLTNRSYRQQQCHPIPASIVQFSTVAVLSSLVLLFRPLKPVAIDWLSFALWGLLLGLLMLLVYLFSYGSLLLIGARTAVVTAFTPLAAMLLVWSFTPRPALTVVQWTGILLVTMGGVAFGQEKLLGAKEPHN